MFETLIESSRGTKRRAGGTVVSLALHAMIVAGAVHATERVVSLGGAVRTDTLTFVVPPPEQARHEPMEGSALPAAPSPVPMAVPDLMPAIIPVELGTKPFDAMAVVGRQVPAGIPELSERRNPGAGVAGVFASTEVDDPAVALSQPAPRYPAELERAGVRGSVELEYVIDATGHVEGGSVRVIASSHDAFIAVARDAILAGLYRPARYRGVAVRQVVRQRIVFSGE